MIYRLITSKSIVAKVIADLDLDESNLRISDIQEWIGEAIEKIGGIHQLSTKVSGENDNGIIKFDNFQAPLPCDLHQLHQVAYSPSHKGGWLPVRFATTSFNKWTNKDKCSNECVISTSENGKCNSCCGTRCYSDDELVRLLMDMHKPIMTHEEALRELNDNINLRQTLVWLISNGDSYGVQSNRGNGSTDFTKDIQYSLKPGYINFNVKSGYVKLSYSAIPRDEHGYVMIPDLASVSEAIYWYVTLKLMYPKYLNGGLPQYIYYDMQRNWNFYRQQAYAEILMPNMDGIETIKNTWNKLYPETKEHETFYDTVGESQKLYNWNRFR